MYQANLLILEDDPILLKKYHKYGLEIFFNVFACSKLNEAISILENETIEIVLTDFKLSSGSGLDFLKIVREKFKFIPVIMLTGYAQKDLVLESIEFNITSFLEKPSSKEVIKSTLSKSFEEYKDLVRDKKIQLKFSLFPHTQNNLIDCYDISKRELEVIKALLEFERNQLIANELGISEGTIKNHLTSIFTKLNIKNKVELKELIYSLNNR